MIVYIYRCRPTKQFILIVSQGKYIYCTITCLFIAWHSNIAMCLHLYKMCHNKEKKTVLM